MANGYGYTMPYHAIHPYAWDSEMMDAMDRSCPSYFVAGFGCAFPSTACWA